MATQFISQPTDAEIEHARRFWRFKPFMRCFIVKRLGKETETYYQTRRPRMNGYCLVWELKKEKEK